MQNVIENLKSQLYEKEQAHTEEREQLKDENLKLSSYLETYKQKLSKFEQKKD